MTTLLLRWAIMLAVILLPLAWLTPVGNSRSLDRQAAPATATSTEGKFASLAFIRPGSANAPARSRPDEYGVAWVILSATCAHAVENRIAKEIEEAGGRVHWNRDSPEVFVDLIYLSGPSWTNSSLGKLKPLKRLQSVILVSTAINDEGLKEMKDFDSLTSLWIEYTRVTEEGLAELNKSLPNLKIRGPTWFRSLPSQIPSVTSPTNGL